MGILRKTVQREVLDLLDNTIFTVDDFDVTFGDPNKNEYIVIIKFRYNNSYKYMIRKYSHEIYEIAVDRSPGDFEEKDIKYYESFSDALIGINDWCIEVRNEMKASQPLYAEVDELRKIIEEHISSDREVTEFSAEDIYILRKKFNELEERVIRLEQDKIITEAQLKEFKSGISQVKDDLEFYPKETWIRTATNKLVKIVAAIGRSKEGRALLSDGARKLLSMDT